MDKFTSERIVDAVEAFNQARLTDEFYYFQNGKCDFEKLKLLKAFLGENCNEGPLFELFMELPTNEFKATIDGDFIILKANSSSIETKITAFYNGNDLSNLSLFMKNGRDSYKTVSCDPRANSITKEYSKKDAAGNLHTVGLSTSVYDSNGMKVSGVAHRFYNDFRIDQVISRTADNPLTYRADNAKVDRYGREVERSELSYNCLELEQMTGNRISKEIEPCSFVEVEFDSDNYFVSNAAKYSDEKSLFPNKKAAASRMLEIYGQSQYGASGGRAM